MQFAALLLSIVQFSLIYVLAADSSDDDNDDWMSIDDDSVHRPTNRRRLEGEPGSSQPQHLPSDVLRRIIKLGVNSVEEDSIMAPIRYREVAPDWKYAADGSYPIWKYKIMHACSIAHAVLNAYIYNIDIHLLFNSNILSIKRVRTGENMKCLAGILEALDPPENIALKMQEKPRITGLVWNDGNPDLSETEAFTIIFDRVAQDLTQLTMKSLHFIAQFDSSQSERYAEVGKRFVNGFSKLNPELFISLRARVLPLIQAFDAAGSPYKNLIDGVARLQTLQFLTLTTLPAELEQRMQDVWPMLCETFHDKPIAKLTFMLSSRSNVQLTLGPIASLFRRTRGSLAEFKISGIHSGQLFQQFGDLSKYRKLYWLTIADPLWDQPLPAGFIRSLLSAPVLKRVLLPTMHPLDVWEWSSVAYETEKFESFIFLGNHEMFQRVWSIGFPNVQLSDLQYRQISDPRGVQNHGLVFRGHRYIQSIGYQSSVNLLPNDRSDPRLTQLTSLDFRLLSCLSVAGLAKKIQHMSALKRLQITVFESPPMQGEQQITWSDLFLKTLILHPTLKELDFRFYQPLMEPLHLLAIIDELAINNYTSRLRKVSIMIPTLPDTRFPNSNSVLLKHLEPRVKKTNLQRFLLILDNEILLNLER